MSNSREFSIDMRMRADFGQAQKEIRDTAREIEGLADTAGKSGGVDNSGIEQNIAAQQAYMRAARATQDVIAQEIAMIGDLQERLSRGASSWEELAETEAKLDQAMARGLVTAEEYDAALADLDKTHAQLERTTNQQQKTLDGTVARYDSAGARARKLDQDEKRLKEAVDAGRISREQYNRAMAGIAQQRTAMQALNSQAAGMRRLNVESAGVQRNLSQLVLYTASGRLGMAGNQVMQLGNQAGIGALAFSKLALAIGGALGISAAFGIQLTKNYLEMRALDTAALSTGRSIGLTTGQLRQQSLEVGAVTKNYAGAAEATKLLVSSGQASADSLQAMTQAAVDLSTLTGNSIQQTTQEVLRLAKAPVPALIELNQRYHFLTAATVEQVQALVDQRREQDAVKLAMQELARVSRERVEEMRRNAGDLEKLWMAVRDRVLETLQAMKDIGSTDIEARLRQANRAIDYEEENIRGAERMRFLYGNNISNSLISMRDRNIAKLIETRDALLLEKLALDDKAESDAAAQKIQNDGIEAYGRINAGLREGATNTQKLSQATRDLQADFRALRESNPDSGLLTDVIFGADGSVRGGAFDQRLKQLQDQFRDRGGAGRSGRSDAQQAEEAARRELANLERQIGLLQEMDEWEKKATEASRIRYEVEEGAYRLSSQAAKDALLDYAQLLDHEQRRIDSAREYVQVQIEIARLQGQPVPPELDAEARKLRELAQYYENFGHAAEAANVRKLLSMRETGDELQRMQQTYNQVMTEIQNAQQRIILGVQSGVLTEAAAQRQIADLYREKLVVLDQLVPQMEAAARALGNPEALANVQRIRLELDQMRQTTNLLVQNTANVFEGAFSSMVSSLATNTATLSEAVRGFFVSMAQGLAQFAAQQLAAMAKAALLRRFMQQGSDGNAVGEGAAKLATAAAATAAGGLAVGSGATVLNTAAVALQSAATTLMIANSMGGFATGGYTGPGGKDQIAGYVHKGEYVMPKETVARYGLDAMRAIHAGRADFSHVPAPMVSRSSAPSLGYADGGLVRGGEMPAPQLHLRNVNMIAGRDVAAATFDDPDNDATILNWMFRHSAEIKQVVG